MKGLVLSECLIVTARNLIANEFWVIVSLVPQPNHLCKIWVVTYFEKAILCGPLRISASSALKGHFNAEVRRGTQRYAEGRRD
jgi:hypothetical protein